MGKKNKFDKIEYKQDYISPDDENSENTDERDDVKRGGADRFTFRKTVRKPSPKREKAIAPHGFVPAHFLMLAVMALSIVGALVADSGFYKSFSGETVYVAYILTSIIIYILPCVVYCMAMKRRPKSVYIRHFSLSDLPLLFVSLALLITLTALEKYCVAYSFAYRVAESVPYGSGVMPTILVSVLLPAICEETLIRGVLQSEYSRFGGGISGISVCALVFALLHFDLPFFFIYFTAGLVLGVVTHVTGSVLPAMLLHFFNNLVALFLADSLTFIASERIGGTFLIVVLAAFGFVFLLIQLQMMEKRSLKMSVKCANNENCEEKLHFLPVQRATIRRFFRLVFSPAMICAAVAFGLFVAYG